MTTPEGRIKNLIKALLLKYNIQSATKAGNFPLDASGWWFSPSQNGLGVAGIPDFIGHYRGEFFALEAKAPGKKPTGFQEHQIKAISSSAGAVFVVDGDLTTFEGWLLCRTQSLE
jgi:hypothetical protein